METYDSFIQLIKIIAKFLSSKFCVTVKRACRRDIAVLLKDKATQHALLYRGINQGG